MVEIDLRRASGPDAYDGLFEMWVDGVFRGPARPASTTASAAVDFVRMGALSVKAGAERHALLGRVRVAAHGGDRPLKRGGAGGEEDSCSPSC